MIIWQQVIETIPSGVVLVDVRLPDMPIIYVNKTFEDNTGYMRDEVIGQNCRFLNGNDTDQPDLHAIREAIKNRTSVQVLLRNYRKNGSLFWNELRIAPILNHYNRAIYFVGVQNDVTQRVSMEQELINSEARYRGMFENNRAIKLVIAPETGQILDCNSAAAEFYGYPVATLRTMNINQINTLSPEAVAQELSHAATEQRSFFEFRHRLASGEIRDVDVFSSPVETAEGVILYSIIADATPRRQAELLYRALFEQSNDAVFILDLNGKHKYVNQRAAELLGYSVDEIRNLSYRDLVISQEHHLSANTLQRMLNGEKIPPYERKMRHKDGHIFSVEINVEIIHDTNGNPLHIQSIVRDITERKHIQERQLALALEQERVDLLTAFLGNAAHEFRTPLSIINASAYIMQHSDIAEKREKKAQQINYQIERITRLVDTLLLFVRLQDKQSIYMGAADLNAILDAACRRLTIVDNENSPTLVNNLSTTLPRIQGNLDYLVEVFIQLLDNAYRHTPPDGKITITGGSKTDAIWIEIADTGTGIKPEHLPHIFETFWREDTAHSTPGFGLGLAIAKTIIERHQGEITVSSVWGAGSCFRVTLPTTQAAL